MSDSGPGKNFLQALPSPDPTTNGCRLDVGRSCFRCTRKPSNLHWLMLVGARTRLVLSLCRSRRLMPRGVLLSLVVCRKLSMNSWPAPPDMAVHVDGEVVFDLSLCPAILCSSAVLLLCLLFVSCYQSLFLSSLLSCPYVPLARNPVALLA